MAEVIISYTLIFLKLWSVLRMKFLIVSERRKQISIVSSVSLYYQLLFLGALAEFLKATVSFVMSVCPTDGTTRSQ